MCTPRCTNTNKREPADLESVEGLLRCRRAAPRPFRCTGSADKREDSWWVGRWRNNAGRNALMEGTDSSVSCLQTLRIAHTKNFIQTATVTNHAADPRPFSFDIARRFEHSPIRNFLQVVVLHSRSRRSSSADRIFRD